MKDIDQHWIDGWQKQLAGYIPGLRPLADAIRAIMIALVELNKEVEELKERCKQ